MISDGTQGITPPEALPLKSPINVFQGRGGRIGLGWKVRHGPPRELSE